MLLTIHSLFQTCFVNWVDTFIVFSHVMLLCTQCFYIDITLYSHLPEVLYSCQLRAVDNL